MGLSVNEGGLGCSVVEITDLGGVQGSTPSVIRFKEKDPYWGDEWKLKQGPSVPQLSKEGLKALNYTCLTKGDYSIYGDIEKQCGIAIFADSKEEGGYGWDLARALRRHGYKVQETKEYINHNTGNTCRLWVWYLDQSGVRLRGARRLSGLPRRRSKQGAGREKLASKVASLGTRLASRVSHSSKTR